MITYALIIVGALFLVMATGTWIGFALYGVALCSLIFLGKGGMQMLLDSILFNGLYSYTLVSLPLFVLMGNILIKSGCSTSLFRGVKRILGPFPGGMLHANIVACGIFAACSGSSTATTVAIGGVSYPELQKAGYYRRLTLGSICAGGTLGILIPPSIMMILYGSLTGNSIGKLFIGGVIPGILLAAMFMIYIAVASIKNPAWTPEREKFGKGFAYLKAVLLGIFELWPVILLIGGIMGSIYGGIATPTEAAAVATVISFILWVFYYRTFTFRLFCEVIKETIFMTSLLMISVIGARALGMALSAFQIPLALSRWIDSLSVSVYAIWAVIVVVYMILGCLIDGIDLIIVSTPVFYPIMVEALGFDPVWFGITLTILVEMSLITPPVGFNLYVTHSVAGGKKLEDTIIGVVPFVIVMLVELAILTVFPDLVLYLPNSMSQ